MIRRRRKRGAPGMGGPLYLVVCAVLLAALLASLLAAVTIGSVAVPAGEAYRVILHRLFGWGDAALYGQGRIHDVVLLIRLPRLILAVAVGMGLSVSGAVMQAVVKNPLAEPYVLGISSGASLGAALALMLGVGTMLGANYVGMAACIGAWAISMGVVALSNVGGRATSVKLLLSGMALSSLCGAFSNCAVYFSSDRDALREVSFWMMGSLAGAQWETNAVILPLTVLGTLFFWTQHRTLNLMLLGDEVSVTLGADLHRRRQLYLLASSVLVGLAVYCAGVIGFVGLVIPHGMRMLVGTDHKKLIPISALSGALFLVWADVLCRVVIPGMELPIGILTSVIGAPCFIYLMVRRRYGFGGGGS